MILADVGPAVKAFASAPANLDRAALARPITSIAYDSRKVRAGSVFVALKGQRTDGIAFVEQALARGAMAIVAETGSCAGVTVPWFVVGDARQALAALAAVIYGHPSREMRVVGITGTNGKTTTAYLLHAVLEASGARCGLIGTVSYRTGRDERDAGRTTPEAPDVQHLLREMVDQQCGACAMEVSSHALALRRVDGIQFAAAVFTNLTRDHLDFHGDMERYFLAKRRLFEMLPDTAVGAVNLDDPRGPSFVDAVRRPITYAIDHPADVTPGPLSFSLDGLRFEARGPWGRVAVHSRLVGRPHVYNILAAIATAGALDVPIRALERGIAGLGGVPGRFQIVSDRSDEVTVVVDYAHTDDALKNLLETARPLAPRRLITVFGCGGERDRTKRPLMGAVAARLSDLVVITSDNPRNEDPEQIVEEVRRGIPAGEDRFRDLGPREGSRVPARTPPVLAIVDRREAIDLAVEEALPGDLVLIVGKGHEKSQVVGDRAYPFDDVAVAQEALTRRRANSQVS